MRQRRDTRRSWGQGHGATLGAGQRLLLVACATGAAAALAWFGTGLAPAWPLVWLAPLPILALAPRLPWWGAGLAALAAWTGGGLGMWGYYAGILKLPPAEALGIVLAPALAFALAALLYRGLLRRGATWMAVLSYPAAWSSLEALASAGSPHGTAGSLAYTQLGFLPVLQLASLTGPWGITFLVGLVPAAAAAVLGLWRSARPTAVRVGVTMTGVVAAALLFGAARLASGPAGPRVRVGLVAGDHPGGVAAAGPATLELAQAYAARASTLAGAGARMVVLPEKLGVVGPDGLPALDAVFQPVADASGATVVVGVVHRAPAGAVNEARIYAPRAPVRGYAKHHLLPGFESWMQPGHALALLDGPGGRAGVAVCKDMDFTALSRAYGRAGAGVLAVPGWDFTADAAFHGHMAVMRGVESGFSVARAAREGLLSVSDDRGRILAEAASGAAPVASLLAEVPVAHEPTLYLALGDWFAWVAAGLLAASVVRLAARGRSGWGARRCGAPAAPISHGRSNRRVHREA